MRFTNLKPKVIAFNKKMGLNQIVIFIRNLTELELFSEELQNERSDKELPMTQLRASLTAVLYFGAVYVAATAL
jgi:hypothetical protein